MKAAREISIESHWLDIRNRITRGENKKAYQGLKTLTKNTLAQDVSHRRLQWQSSHRKQCCAQPMNLGLEGPVNFLLKTDAIIFRNSQARDSKPTELPVVWVEVEKAVHRNSTSKMASF